MTMISNAIIFLRILLRDCPNPRWSGTGGRYGRTYFHNILMNEMNVTRCHPSVDISNYYRQVGYQGSFYALELRSNIRTSILTATSEGKRNIYFPNEANYSISLNEEIVLYANGYMPNPDLPSSICFDFFGVCNTNRLRAKRWTR